MWRSKLQVPISVTLDTSYERLVRKPGEACNASKNSINPPLWSPQYNWRYMGISDIVLMPSAIGIELSLDVRREDRSGIRGVKNAGCFAMPASRMKGNWGRMELGAITPHLSIIFDSHCSYFRGFEGTIRVWKTMMVWNWKVQIAVVTSCCRGNYLFIKTCFLHSATYPNTSQSSKTSKFHSTITISLQMSSSLYFPYCTNGFFDGFPLNGDEIQPLSTFVLWPRWLCVSS